MSNSTQTARQSVLVVGLRFGLIRLLNQAVSEKPRGFWDSEKNELGKQGKRAVRGSTEDERR